jgi:hypothetical protein
VTGAEPGAIVAVKVLVKQKAIPLPGFVLEFFRATKDTLELSEDDRGSASMFYIGDTASPGEDRRRRGFGTRSSSVGLCIAYPKLARCNGLQ